MTLRPFMIPPYRTSQRVGLRINAHPVGEERVQDDTAIGVRIPAALAVNRADIEITLLCPDALSPKEAAVGEDPKKLSVRLRDMLLIWADPEPLQPVRRLPPLPIGPDISAPRTTELMRSYTGHAPDGLMLQFESLGANCEFGLVQRALGAEPLRLLRFVGVDVQNLLSGLDFGFSSIDDPANTRICTDGGEDSRYVPVNGRYAIHRHSSQRASAMSEAASLHTEISKIALERRRFLKILQTGQKLFVCQRFESMTPAHAMPILNMLRSHGPNALLFVALNHAAPAGSVDLLGPDLYFGNLDRLAPPGNAVDRNVPAWISICANAYRFWRQTGHGGELN